MGGPYEDHADVRDRQVDAVGNGDAFGVGSKVVVQDRTTLQRPFPAGVLKAPEQLLLFRVDADDRQVGDGEALAERGDLPKLRVALRR